MNKKEFNYSKGYTHAGVFHADEVFSTALCLLINNKWFSYTRGFKPKEVMNDDSYIVYDIGNGEYDHHSLPRETRESSGIPYAAFGKLWRDFGWTLCNNENVWKKIDDTFVSSIDAVDNGYEDSRNELSSYISSLNPLWDEESNQDEQFKTAVKFAVQVLSRTIERANSSERAISIVTEKLAEMDETTKTVVLDRFVPWQEVLIPSEAEFIIYPSLRGGVSLQVVPVSTESRDAKHPIPEKYWGGLEKAEGMTFCHNTGFLASFDTVEHAIDFVKSIE